MTCSRKRQRRLSLRSRTDIGINESRFLFVLDMIVLNLLDEGRRTYSLCTICVLSLIILLALHSTCFSYKAVRGGCLNLVLCFYMIIMWVAVLNLVVGSTNDDLVGGARYHPGYVRQSDDGIGARLHTEHHVVGSAHRQPEPLIVIPVFRCYPGYIACEQRVMCHVYA